MKVGLISDTHSHVDPRIAEYFRGVEHILHAGDIGRPSVLLELEQIAPVTAVLGNCDQGLPGKETQVLELGGYKLLLHHIVPLDRFDAPIRRRIEREQPQIVVFGHTHRFCEKRLGGILYVNPGYASKPKLGMERSIALLHVANGAIRVERIAL